MPGRHRRPIAALLLEGKYRADRHGRLEDAWLPDGEPERPAWLTGDGLALWQELSPRLIESKIAMSLDAAELAGLCDWWGRYREISRLLDTIESRQSREYYRCSILAAMAWKNFATAAGKFGLNPADRSRLQFGSQPTADDALSAFANQRDKTPT